MGDDMKEIAKLRFDISMAEGQLETLNKAFEKFNKTNKTVLNDYVKTQNKIAVENLKKNNKIEVQENNTLNKIKVINAKRELEEQKTLNKITVMNEKAALTNNNIWSKMSNMANTYLTGRGLNELRQAAGELVQEMADVEYRMVEIDRVLNEDSLNIDKYRDKLIQLAYDYGNSFDNVSDVTLRLAQAGFDSNESLALTEKTLLALNTAELDATQATEDMVAVMSQWNLMTGDANKISADYARIIDEINITADNFPTTSEDILEALKKTSSAFNIAGASIEETIATIVAAEKASQRGGKAIGTALNNIVQKLRDTGAMSTMEAMGLDIYTDSAKTEFKSVMDILSELSEKMEQLKKEGKENTKEMQDLLSVFTLFRRNVGTALLGEMEDGGTYDQVLKLLGENGEGALGYSLKENENYMGTATAAMERFNAEVMKLKTEIWDAGLRDVFVGMLSLGGDLIGIISELIDIFGKSSTTISLFVDLLEVLSTTLKGVKDGLNAVKESTKFIQDINDALENGGVAAKVFNRYTDTLKNSLLAMNPEMIPVIDMLDSLMEKEEETSETTENLVNDLIDKVQEKIESGAEEISDGGLITGVKDNFVELASEIEKLSSQFDMVTKAANEFNSTGAITASTFKNVVDNGLLQYLDIVNGKMVVNEQYFANAAEAAKQKAIADLEERAAAEILSIVTADLNGTLEETLPAGNNAAIGINTAANEAINAANKFLQGKMAAEQFKSSLDKLAGKSIGNFSGLSEKAQAQIKNVTTELQREIKMVNSLASGVTKASKSAASGAGSAGKSATKTFEEQSQERVKTFKKEIDDLESLEKSWVNKYKKLELFSTDDLKFITHQRINRYNEYLNQINNLQGISEKDRADLVKEYSAKRQEAELEYFDLLKQKLEDQIKQLKEANEERIKGIKEAADAQIDALKKVEDENDKIKQKEEYERKRNELIYGNQGIEYWRQRTGRDAQLALQDAEEKLRDLDEDWEDKKKDWTLDDQIEEIEKARDAQIKAIEDAQEEQIKGWQAAYNEQVRLYAETGQIIYDDSVINAGYLYNAYMDNFVNPLQSQLQNVIASLNTASATASEVAGKMGSGGSGGSVATIANNIANAQVQGPQPVSVTGVPTWSDIQARATKAKLTSAVKKLFGKFHGGGEVGSSTEALAILRPKEVVLQPEWAATIKKLERSVSNGIGISGGTNIDVQGNLINMDGVKINDRKDADYLTERIEKVFRDKFNIRK